MKPEDQQARKRLVVQSAADLLEWAGDVADEIKKRHQENDQECWISPDSLGLSERVLIAQILSSVSLRNLAGLDENIGVTASREARAKLAELAKGLSTYKPVQPVMVPTPEVADAELARLREHMEKMRAQPAEVGMGEVVACAPPDCILSVWHDGQRFMVQYDGPLPAPPRGPFSTMTRCGDLVQTIETVRAMFQLFNEAGGRGSA